MDWVKVAKTAIVLLGAFSVGMVLAAGYRELVLQIYPTPHEMRMRAFWFIIAFACAAAVAPKRRP